MTDFHHRSKGADWRISARRVAEAPFGTAFTDLVRIAGLDPTRDLRLADWSGVSFVGLDLNGFDFTGARLHECDFTGARIAGACFHQAELGQVIHRLGRDAHQPAETTGTANLRDAADWKTYANPKNWNEPKGLTDDRHLPVGAIFQDAPFAPDMVVVPAGGFMMGTSSEEVAVLAEEHGKAHGTWLGREGPQHPVTIAEPFAVGRFAVTFEEWDAAQKHWLWQQYAGLAPRRPDDQKWRRGLRPVINVSWNDVSAYCRWVAAMTGKRYRLLTEPEWEYCCRAGTTTAYGTGNSIRKDQAQFGARGTVEVGTFPANAWGLHEMHGNVSEWCQDEWHDRYDGAPNDGSAWESGGEQRTIRVVRGGAWEVRAEYQRSACRGGSNTDSRGASIGFRVARALAA